MKSGKFWLAVLVGGVVANVFDGVLHGMILQKAYYNQLTDLFNAAGNPMWYILGDFIFAFVFVWVYDRVYGSFGGGAKGGATYGMYAGVLLNFPMWILMGMMFRGFPYALSWIWTITGILYAVIIGAVVGALYKKGEATQAAS